MLALHSKWCVVLLLLTPSLSALEQRIDTVHFSNGDTHLTGWLYRPVPESASPSPVVVLLHGAGMGRHDHPVYMDLVRELNQLGVQIFSYDRGGEGLSTGSK